MYANSFIPMVNRPTRVTNLYTNHYSIKNVSYSGILTTDVSDHLPVSHISQKGCEYPTNNEYKTIRVINEIKTLMFMDKIQNTNWSALDPLNIVRHTFQTFLDCLKVYMMNPSLLSTLR